MATVSVRAVADSCLDRRGTLSLKRDVFGVYGNNDQTRSLREQLRLIQTAPFVRLAVVTLRPPGSTLGQYENLQRDLDAANEIWQRDCGAWIYCVGSVVDASGIIGANVVLDQPGGCPLGVQENPSTEETALFNLGRNLGADVVGYYTNGSQNPNFGCCAAFPQGHPGFWVRIASANQPQGQNFFAHELTHVIGLNPHPENDPDVPDNDQDNIMWRAPRTISNLPPDLRSVQCDRIRDDDNTETC